MGHVLHFSSKEETPSEEGRDSEEERDKFSPEEEADLLKEPHCLKTMIGMR